MVSTIPTLNLQKKNFDPIQYIEQKFFLKRHQSLLSESSLSENSTNEIFLKLGNDKKKIQIGKQIKIAYIITEGNKERIQYFEGLIIAKKNKGLTKTFTLRRTVQGIGVEQVFFFYSPKIQSITERQIFKVRRAKLYFVRSLSGKSAKLKTKI